MLTYQDTDFTNINNEELLPNLDPNFALNIPFLVKKTGQERANCISINIFINNDSLAAHKFYDTFISIINAYTPYKPNINYIFHLYFLKSTQSSTKPSKFKNIELSQNHLDCFNFLKGKFKFDNDALNRMPLLRHDKEFISNIFYNAERYISSRVQSTRFILPNSQTIHTFTSTIENLIHSYQKSFYFATSSCYEGDDDLLSRLYDFGLGATPTCIKIGIACKASIFNRRTYTMKDTDVFINLTKEAFLSFLREGELKYHTTINNHDIR